MFVDDSGWGDPREPKPEPKRVVTQHRERTMMQLILAHVAAVLIAWAGGGAILGLMVVVADYLR